MCDTMYERDEKLRSPVPFHISSIYSVFCKMKNSSDTHVESNAGLKMRHSAAGEN